MMGGLAAEGKFAGPPLLPWAGRADAALSQGGRLRAGGVSGRRGVGTWREKRGWGGAGIDLTGAQREAVQTDGNRTYRCGGTWRLQREAASSRERDTHVGGQRRDRETDAWTAAESECPRRTAWTPRALSISPALPPSPPLLPLEPLFRAGGWGWGLPGLETLHWAQGL